MSLKKLLRPNSSEHNRLLINTALTETLHKNLRFCDLVNK